MGLIRACGGARGMLCFWCRLCCRLPQLKTNSFLQSYAPDTQDLGGMSGHAPQKSHLAAPLANSQACTTATVP